MAWSYLRYLDIARSSGEHAMKRLIPAFVVVLVVGGALGYGLTHWLRKGAPAAAAARIARFSIGTTPWCPT